VTSEVFPLLKTGGLADVSAALPAALNDLGIDTSILMPAYRQALARASQVQVVAQLGDLLGCGEARLLETQLPDTGVPVWMVDCPALYDRSGGAYQDEQGNDWQDNALRFALLSRVAALLPDAPIAGTWRPDILHVHDWHAALVPLMMAGGGGPPTVLTIHNLAYQGSFPLDTLGRLGLDQRHAYRALEFHGRLCFLKAGIAWADALTTVSPTYAEEIQREPLGFGLQGLLSGRAGDLVGILNGVDTSLWDPAGDPHLPVR
jgi:starch synthase